MFPIFSYPCISSNNRGSFWWCIYCRCIFMKDINMWSNAPTWNAHTTSQANTNVLLAAADARMKHTIIVRSGNEERRDRKKEVLVAQGALSRQLGPLGVDWKITCVNNMLFNILYGMRESIIILCRLCFLLSLFSNAMAKKGYTRSLSLVHSLSFAGLRYLFVFWCRVSHMTHLFITMHGWWCFDGRKKNPVFKWKKYCAQYPLSFSFSEWRGTNHSKSDRE